MPERSELPEALHAALVQLAQAEIPEILAEARAVARARAKAVIEDALVEEFLRAAAASEDSTYQRPSEPDRMRTEREVPEPAAAGMRAEHEVPEPHRGDLWWA